MPHKNYGSQENKAIQSLKMEDNGMFILQTKVFLLNTCVYIQCSWNYNLILSEVLIDLLKYPRL